MEKNSMAQPEGNYYDKYNSSNVIVKWMMKHYFDALQSLLPQKRKDLKILEVGCGEGEVIGYVTSFYKDNCKADAFDISDKVISKAKKAYPQIHFTTGNAYKIGKTGYDLVLCCEVLEHLDNPGGVLRELKHTTQEYLIVSVPREPIWRMLNMLRGKYWRDLGNTPGHIQHWSSRKFLYFLQESGMEIVRIKKPIPWIMVLLKSEDRKKNG